MVIWAKNWRQCRFLTKFTIFFSKFAGFFSKFAGFFFREKRCPFCENWQSFLWKVVVFSKFSVILSVICRVFFVPRYGFCPHLSSFFLLKFVVFLSKMYRVFYINLPCFLSKFAVLFYQNLSRFSSKFVVFFGQNWPFFVRICTNHWFKLAKVLG